MRKTTLDSIKACDSIFSNGADVLVCGKRVWLFRADGTFVARVDPLRRPWKVAFLPNRRALIDCYGDKMYHYISLENGIVLWSTPKKGRRQVGSTHFAVSPDGTTLYDCCTTLDSFTTQIDVICPEQKRYEQIKITSGLNLTVDIFFDSEGDLCLYQSGLMEDRAEDSEQYEARPSRFQYGILALDDQNLSAPFHWKRKWESEYHWSVGCDGRFILCRDLSVMDLETKSTFPILPENESASLPKRSFRRFYDKQRKLLTLHYLGGNRSVVIDCEARRVVASYDRDDSGLGYIGCLVGDEFWMGTSNGVVRLPFPDNGEEK